MKTWILILSGRTKLQQSHRIRTMIDTTRPQPRTLYRHAIMGLLDPPVEKTAQTIQAQYLMLAMKGRLAESNDRSSTSSSRITLKGPLVQCLLGAHR